MTTLPPRPGARQSMSEVRRREAAFLRSVSGRPQAVENLWLKLGRIFFVQILQKLSEMSPRDNLIRTRWKRDNIFGQTQKKIQKEIHLVSNKTGVNPWVVLGIQYWVVTLKSSMRAIKVKERLKESIHKNIHCFSFSFATTQFCKIKAHWLQSLLWLLD